MQSCNFKGSARKAPRQPDQQRARRQSHNTRPAQAFRPLFGGLAREPGHRGGEQGVGHPLQRHGYAEAEQNQRAGTYCPAPPPWLEK